MLPVEPLRLSATEFVEWAGGKPSGLIPAETRITLDSWCKGESFIDVLKRITRELRDGAKKVVLFSDCDRAVCVYADDTAPRLFRDSDDLVIPDVLPGFTVPVARFFE